MPVNLHQIGIATQQYFDDWNGQFFLHHPFDADVLSQVADAESFAEIYWEDKIMPYVNPAVRQRGDRQGGRAGRRRADLPLPVRHLQADALPPPDHGTVDGISDRTSYLMNSQLSHLTRRYGRWTLPRFQYEIGLSNFVAYNERDARRHPHQPQAGDPRRTTTTSGSARPSSTPGSPGTATACRTSSTSTATPSRSTGRRRCWGCIRGAVLCGVALLPVRRADGAGAGREGRLPDGAGGRTPLLGGWKCPERRRP